MFIDQVSVRLKAGDGGDGLVSFRRERFVDKGGPDGGDGGDGGDVVFVGDRNLNTLRSFRKSQILKADDGKAGGSQKKHGKNGKDLRVKVPVGTVVSRESEILGDITDDKQELVVAFGGGGGFGNAHFKSSRRQAPKVAEKGEPGDEYEVSLELKLLADVGLVGLPNAGKSTLLSVVSNAKPQIANYPFTTLEPNLGVADIDRTSLLIADIPGLIEGASQGKGLGDDFLRHIERTAVLIHLVDAYSDDVVHDFKVIDAELKKYKVNLTTRPRVVVLSKIDGLDDDIVQDQVKKIKKVAKKLPILSISSQANIGLDELLRHTKGVVLESRQADVEKTKTSKGAHVKVYELDNKNYWKVAQVNETTFRVYGPKIERFAKRTNYENEWGVHRLKDIMNKIGIMHELERLGAEQGSVVYFGDNKNWKISL